MLYGAGFYEEAVQVASQLSQSVDDSTLHALVQRVGARAEAQAQRRYEQPAQERLPQRGPSELAVLMVYGCQLRYRGAGWGKKKTSNTRVEWHELKLGVFYRQEEGARTESGRSLLIDKLVVCWQDQALELGRRGLGLEFEGGSLELGQGTLGLLSRDAPCTTRSSPIFRSGWNPCGISSDTESNAKLCARSSSLRNGVASREK